MGLDWLDWFTVFVAAVAAYFLLRRRGGIDTELRVVLGTAERIAHDGGKRVVSDAHFVRAALCNRDVAGAFSEAGWSTTAAAGELDAISLDERSEPAAGPLSPALLDAHKRAGRAAVLRWDPVATLVDVLTAIRDHADTPTSRLLRARAIRFEDPVMVTVTPGNPGDAPTERFVYLLNDPISPMPSVVTLLRTTFGLDEVHAVYVMLTVHHRGYAALGPYEVDAVDGILERAELAARNLGMDKFTLAREAPNTAVWKKTDAGRLPPT